MISPDEESVDERKWLPEFLLSGDEKLIETGNWLTDRHIIYSHTDDTEDFPCVDGLQVTRLAETGGCTIVVQEGVHILNDSNKYWLCVSTIGCPPNTIDTYDSWDINEFQHIIRHHTSHHQANNQFPPLPGTILHSPGH